MFEYKTYNNTIILTKYIGSSLHVVVPSVYKTLPVKTIGDHCFEKTWIKDIVIEEGIETIGERAFANCIALEKVILPASLRKIGKNAFSLTGRSKRKNTLELIIPEGVQEIGMNAFLHNEFEYLVFPASIKKYGTQGEQVIAFIDKKLVDIKENMRLSASIGYLYLLKDHFDIREDVKDANKEYLTSVVVELMEELLKRNKELIPVLLSIRCISYKDYDECADLLDDIYVAEMLEYKNHFTQEEMKKYQQLKDQELFSIPVGVLKKLWSIEPLTKTEIERYQQLDKDYDYQNTYKITGYKGNESYVDVPVSIGKKMISVVDLKQSTSEIISLSIPEGIRTLHSLSAIKDCIEEVYLDVVSIDDECFTGMEQLEYVGLSDNLVDIGNSCFSECGIEKIDLCGKVRVLPEYCFYGCVKLKEVKLPDALEIIGETAFNECIALHSIVLPSSLKEIWGSAFYHSGLESIIIPEGVKEIGDGCFEDCKQLKSVILPSSLKIAGDDLFRGCKALKKIENHSKIKIKK